MTKRRGSGGGKPGGKGNHQAGRGSGRVEIKVIKVRDRYMCCHDLCRKNCIVLKCAAYLSNIVTSYYICIQSMGITSRMPKADLKIRFNADCPIWWVPVSSSDLCWMLANVSPHVSPELASPCEEEMFTFKTIRQLTGLLSCSITCQLSRNELWVSKPPFNSKKIYPKYVTISRHAGCDFDAVTALTSIA